MSEPERCVTCGHAMLLHRAPDEGPPGPYCPSCEDDLQHLYRLFYGDLKICGCGCPEEVYALVRDILALAPFYEDWRKVRDRIGGNEGDDGPYYLILYVLDNAGLIEHGGSIGGSWLTKKGTHYLGLMKRHEWRAIEPELENGLGYAPVGYPHDGQDCGPECRHWQKAERKP